MIATPDSTAPTVARRTIAEPVSLAGLSLFTAQPARVDIRPAASGGIRFVRVDLPERPVIEAHPDRIAPAALHPVFERQPPRYTSLAAPGSAASPGSQAIARVCLVEHLLAALAGFGITDAEIETDSEELPIFDGSAGLFAQMIAAAGTRAIEGATIRPIVVTEAFEIEGIRIEPRQGPGALYRYELDYGTHPALGRQAAEIVLDGSEQSVRRFATDLAPARTFSLAEEVQPLRALGLFAHLSAEQMLVLGPFGPIDNAYRYDNEPARHKLLDLVGDLALAGRPINATITASRTGHAANQTAARALADLP